MQDFKNDIIDGVTKAIDNAVNTVTDRINAKLLESFKWLCLTIIDNSYNICLSVAMLGLICYLGGYKKGAKVVTLSLVIFFVLQAIKGVIV